MEKFVSHALMATGKAIVSAIESVCKNIKGDGADNRIEPSIRMIRIFGLDGEMYRSGDIDGQISLELFIHEITSNILLIPLKPKSYFFTLEPGLFEALVSFEDNVTSKKHWIHLEYYCNGILEILPLEEYIRKEVNRVFGFMGGLVGDAFDNDKLIKGFIEGIVKDIFEDPSRADDYLVKLKIDGTNFCSDILSKTQDLVTDHIHSSFKNS